MKESLAFGDRVMYRRYRNLRPVWLAETFSWAQCRIVLSDGGLARRHRGRRMLHTEDSIAELRKKPRLPKQKEIPVILTFAGPSAGTRDGPFPDIAER